MKVVDREAKVIRNYSVMSLGEARGHGVAVDSTTLDELVAMGNAPSGGIKTRVRHPNPVHDGFGRLLGKSRNFRREGDKVVADLHLSDSAFKSPEGDLGTYVMELASSDDDTFGASPEVLHKKLKTAGAMPVMRLKELTAIAIVDDPATNKGFFSCITGDDDMAEETKLTELTAERDLLAEEVARLKTENAKFQTDLTAKSAELSVAKAEATTAAATAERARVGDILALCSKAGKAELSAKYIADGTATADLQKALFDVLCAKNGAIDGAGGEGGGGELKTDHDAEFKKEYAADRAMLQKAGISEEAYLSSRRVTDQHQGQVTMLPKPKAA